MEFTADFTRIGESPKLIDDYGTLGTFTWLDPRIAARELEEQMNTCSCLTLILACIIYWQTREIERVLEEPRRPSDSALDLSLLEHISPISWENVLLYGQYNLDRKLIRAA